MNSRFASCLKFVLAFEGGKVDDPTDRGGRTAYGITQDTFTGARLKAGLPVKDVWEISQGEVEDLYSEAYWSKLSCSLMPVGLDLCVFDAGVNCGCTRAAKWLQRVLKIPAQDIDGNIGPKTLKAVHDLISANEVNEAIVSYQRIRQDHYDALIAKVPSQAKYARGWGRRLNECTAAAKECRA